jgi:hypothetical protein
MNELKKRHFRHSSFREKLIEHPFIGELLKLSWKEGACTLEVAKPEVDNQGYDIIVEDKGIVRHIQLQAAHRKARVSRQKIHTALANKPSGCVIWIYFDEDTLELGPFLFFGGLAGEPLPDISDMRVAKHTKGNAQGIKLERLAIRVVNKGQFTSYNKIEQLYAVLFA